MTTPKKPKKLGDLRQDPRNARRHTERNVGMIRDALTEVGAGRSILIDEENRIIAGNGTVRAAAEAGITKVHVVDTPPDTLVAVRRTDLTPEQKRRMALFDNRSAELAEWDANVLAQLAAEGTLLDDLFAPDELQALVEPAGDEAAPVEALRVNQPTDVAWVLVAVPLAKWPEHQAALETLQDAAVFSTMVIRPVESMKAVTAAAAAGPPAPTGTKKKPKTHAVQED